MSKASYLIDPDIIVDLINRRTGIREKVNQVGLVNCYVSELTIAELTYGAHFSSRVQSRLIETTELSNALTVIPISEAIPLFGKEKARLRRAGQLIPDFDLMIATTAITYGFVLVTGNERHLGRVEGIEIQNWRKAEFNTFVTEN